MPVEIRSERFKRCIQSLTALVDSNPSEDAVLDRAGGLLGALVAHDDWLPHAYAIPDPLRYQQFLLYVDPAKRFSVVSFVWGPGQETPIHDHTVWGLVGMLRGAEYSQAYRHAQDGTLKPHGAPVRLVPGAVEPLSPKAGDIHQVSNAFADRVSISVHVYGADIGEVRRSFFLENGVRKPFISGYSNEKPKTDATIGIRSFADVRAALLEKREIALLDVREEAPFAEAHPLFAANLPLARVELDAHARIPRRSTEIVVYDNDEGFAPVAALRLIAAGYTNVYLLDGGLAGWSAAGGEIFKDVNVPSKSFGELVEAQRHTPSLSATEVKALIDSKADIVVLDARRFDEYQTMNIPTSISVPGAELVLRVRELAPRPETRVIVNCAGRTRSIIGTQSLVNAGIPNPVHALRNGTIGWTLAGLELERGQQRRFMEADAQNRATANASSRQVADRAGVGRASLADVLHWQNESGRTTYLFDVRTPEEYEAGHLPGFSSAPGGQLVQETDHVAPVRGARIVLADGDGARANMTASWLAQMGWEVHVLDGVEPKEFKQTGPAARLLPALPPLDPASRITPDMLEDWLDKDAEGDTLVIDLATSAAYLRRHIPGAWFASRTLLTDAFGLLPAAGRIVLTSPDGLLAQFAEPEAKRLTGAPVFVLDGGSEAWFAAGKPAESGAGHFASECIDRYRRPYEGTDNPVEAMQGYLDWEFGLVEQLGRDGTHGFFVI